MYTDTEDKEFLQSKLYNSFLIFILIFQFVKAPPTTILKQNVIFVNLTKRALTSDGTDGTMIHDKIPTPKYVIRNNNLTTNMA